MNSTSFYSRCASTRNYSDFNDSSPSLKFYSEIAFLSSFNVFVVIGNCLVLLALAIDRQLRTPTHYFIGSLAVADLALGIFVLPFATDLQLRGYWNFGSFFCQIWLAFDVWLCTASIYSLIAVTFDRFIAVTKPLTYKLVMTKRKASLLIVVVWMAALVICLPAFGFSLHRTYRLSTVTCQCTQMAHSTVYIAYSSTGSFYLPMVIIVYLYARIYTTVRKIRLSGSTGIVSMAKSAMAGGATAMAAAHAGTARMKKSASDTCNQHATLLEKGPQLSATLRVHKGKYQPAKRSSSPKRKLDRGISSNRFSGLSANSDQKLHDEQNGNYCEHHEMIVVETHDDPGADLGSLNGTPGFQHRRFDDMDMRFLTVNSAAPSCPSSASNSPRGSVTAETRMFEQQISSAAAQNVTAAGATNPATAAADLWLHIIMPSQLTSLWCHRMAVFQKYQKKFTLELKALKTVGIVTGCFLACWLGFCIVYTMQALPYCRDRKKAVTAIVSSIAQNVIAGTVGPSINFATASASSSIGSCVPDWVTNVMVWLGYVNSAMNPIIYGVSNKQFRRTFRRIIRCDFSWRTCSMSSRERKRSDAAYQKRLT